MESKVSLLLLLPLACVLAILFRNLKSPLRHVPGPWHTFLCNWILKYHTVCGHRIYYIDSLHKQYGTIVRIAPGEVSVATAAAYKQIYSVSSKFTKHEWYQAFSGHPRPSVFSMPDIKEHGYRRRIFARAFTKSQLRANWEPEVRQVADLAVLKIQEELESKESCDIMKWFRFMASDTSGMLMFGDNFRCLERGASHEVIDIIETYMMGTSISAEFPLVGGVAKLIPHPYIQQMFKGWGSILDFANIAVNRTRQQAQGGGKTIFGDVLERTEKNESLANEDIRYEAGNFTVAGTETTAITLTYIIWAILSRPNVRAQVEEEVSTLPDDYTDEDVERLCFLQAVIKESQRLYGAVQGWLPRVVPAGGAHIEGYFVPPGTTIGAQGYTMYRNSSIYTNSEEFDPSRWFPEASISTEAKLVYNPFGPGSRICLGIHLAEMELRLVAAAFFRRCRGVRIAPVTTPETMEFLNFFSTFPKSGTCHITR